MGNGSGKEAENGNAGPSDRADGDPSSVARSESLDPMGSSTMDSPRRSRSPLMFAPQVPIDPLQRPADGPQVHNQLSTNGSYVLTSVPFKKVVPTLITWSYGGNHVMVEGSWDNWTSRKTLQRTGKDHSIILVLPGGIYHYRFMVDGVRRYIPDLPSVTDEMGQVTHILDVDDYVQENLDGVSELDDPLSPGSSYSHSFPSEEDFAKEPPAVPPQLHLNVLDSQGSGEDSRKPQYVALNHLYIERGWSSQSLVALGMTHRFESKYVTVILYKPTS